MKKPLCVCGHYESSHMRDAKWCKRHLTCGCEKFRPRNVASVLKVRFDEKTKSKHGIEPFTAQFAAQEIEKWKRRALDNDTETVATVNRLRAMAANALLAFEEGRRGDGMSILRGITAKKAMPPAPVLDDTPGAA